MIRGVHQGAFSKESSVRIAIHLEQLTLLQIINGLTKYCYEASAQLRRGRRQDITKVSSGLRDQDMIASQARLACFSVSFAEEKLAEARATQREEHTKAQGAMLLQQRVLSTKPKEV